MDPEIVDAPDAVAMTRASTRGKVRFRDVSFQYPTAAVPSHLAHEAVARGLEGEPELELEFEAAAAAAEPPNPSSTATATPMPSPPSPSVSSTSTSRPNPASSSRWSARRASGKTTTTYLVSRLYDVDSGAVEIDDVDVRRIKLASLGEIIGAVTQETYLFHASVRDNLRYAKPEATEDELIAAATAASIHERDHRAPRRLRHDRRRARLQAVGRREAADGDRPGAAQGPAHPDPRRGDLGARHRLGAAHPARVRAPDGGPHDDRHRPPAVDDPARRPDRGLRARPHRSSVAPTPSCSRMAGCTPGCTASSSSPTTRPTGRRSTTSPRRSRWPASERGALMPTLKSVELRHDGRMRFEAMPSSGHALDFDDRKSNRGGSPVETILAALGACTAMDVVSIAGKKRQPIDEYRIHVRGSQRDEYPQVFTDIVVVHEVIGRDVSEVAIRRCIELSATKYCPVSAMLSAGRDGHPPPLPDRVERGRRRTRPRARSSRPGRTRGPRSWPISASRSAVVDRLGREVRDVEARAAAGPDPGHEVRHPPAQEVQPAAEAVAGRRQQGLERGDRQHEPPADGRRVQDE